MHVGGAERVAGAVVFFDREVLEDACEVLHV